MVFGLLLAAPVASTATFTVGAGAGCTSATIEAALFGAAFTSEADTIRLVNDQVYSAQGFTITNMSVTIVGGYTSCADTTPSSTGTELDGTGAPSEPVVTIEYTGSGSAPYVQLKNLKLRHAEVEGLRITGDAVVDLVNTEVGFNSGGGVTMNGGDLYIDPDSYVANNDGSSGAGVHCLGAVLSLAGGIFNNVATASGGGVYAGAGCQLTSYAGGFAKGIFQNQAVDGGGIYAEDGAQVLLFGGASSAALVSENTASVYGGGIYAGGVGTWVRVWNSVISGNQALNGGGVLVETGAHFDMMRTQEACHTPDRCSQLSDNETDDYHGAALVAQGGARARVWQTYVEGNHIPSYPAGWLFYVTGAGTELLLEGDVIDHNDVGTVLDVADSASATVAFATVTSNGCGAGDCMATLTQVDAYTTTRIYSSIIEDLPVLGAYPEVDPYTFDWDCLVVSNSLGLPTGGHRSLEGDPGFRDRAGGDFHLRSDGFAVDFCNTSVYSPTRRDVDHQERGDQHPLVFDKFGRWDAGADELEILFADGFASGSTTAWSTVVP